MYFAIPSEIAAQVSHVGLLSSRFPDVLSDFPADDVVRSVWRYHIGTTLSQQRSRSSRWFWKLRPLIDVLAKQFSTVFIPNKISVDENL